MKAVALASVAIALSGCASALPDPQASATNKPATHVTHDWNGDGILDRAAIVAGGDDGLILQVETGGPDSTVQRLVLQDNGSLLYPGLLVEGDRLVLKQLTGGTTAVSSSHRFAWDDTLGAMRLIRLEATLYSRTFAHDGREATWDLLDGTLTTQTMQLRQDDGDRAYDIIDQKVTARPSPPLRLADAPSGDDLLGWPGPGL